MYMKNIFMHIVILILFIIIYIIMNKIKNDLKILTKDINNIFVNANENIRDILKVNNINTRTKKLSFTDALTYKFLCAYKNYTNTQVVADLNFANSKVDINNYYKKEQKIPLEYYENILNNTKQILNKYSNKNLKDRIIAVDGTYNNTNFKNDKKLETTLNMGYYDVSNCVPIHIDLKNYSDKNKEISAFMEYVNDAKLEMQNIIFVMDRAYFSYDLFEYLNKKNIKFVIRVKNNCVHLKKNKSILRKNKCEYVRFVSYNTTITSIIKDKKNKDRSVTRNLSCNIATNLNHTYNDDTIKNIYKSRWDVEVFFKLIKSNFKFSYLTEHNTQTRICYLKKYIVILINCMLERIFELVLEDLPKNDKYNIKYNKSLALNGLKQIIPNIINSILTSEILFKYLNNFFTLVYSEKNKNNARTSKIPFSKWYVKDYINKYKNEKLIDAIDNNTLEKLNKNLKMEALTITLL